MVVVQGDILLLLRGENGPFSSIIAGIPDKKKSQSRQFNSVMRVLTQPE